MFAFDSHETVKKIIQFLPAVGIGPTYGLPRTRLVYLADSERGQLELKFQGSFSSLRSL